MAESKKQVPTSQLVLGIALFVSLLLLSNEAMSRGWIDQGKSLVSGLFTQETGQVVDNKASIERKSSSPKTVMGKKPEGKRAKQKGDKARQLNDKGVELILKKKYWQGLYLFKKAIDLDNTRIEPHLNMAIALKEVGLIRPAGRYLKEAERIDEENPILLKNYAVILDEGYGDSISPEDKKVPVEIRFQGKKRFDSEHVMRLWGLDIQ